MDAILASYLALWVIACIVALMLAVMFRCHLTLIRGDYWRYLTMPWKWISFVTATTGMTVIAPYTGDITWDYVDALFMSVLTYLTAPWAIGVLYQGLRGKQKIAVMYIALCCWLFSASWSYDLYILLRDGYYPVTWWSNLFLSSVLYVCAGLMWNLEVSPQRGVEFGFYRDDWPRRLPDDRFMRLFWFALPFMILVAVLILSFVVPIPFLSAE